MKNKILICSIILIVLLINGCSNNELTNGNLFFKFLKKKLQRIPNKGSEKIYNYHKEWYGFIFKGFGEIRNY